MSLRDIVFGAAPEPVYARTGVEAQIAAAINQRQSDFSMSDALSMPAVARSVDLIVSLGSGFTPVEFTDGFASPQQPRFIRRPDPYTTRQEFVAQTIHSLIENGEYFWLLGTRDDRGYPRFAMNIANDEVNVQWDDRRFHPTYEWRGRTLIHGIDIVHGAINRRVGQLHGTSVLKEALPYLATVDAAENYAAAAFGSNGIPLTVLKVMQKLTKDEADKLKTQWATSRQLNPYEPAVASGGVDPIFPSVDPQKMQMQESRSYGARVVATLLGIPAPLLHVETSGATITYQNPEGSLDALVKGTIIPRYLSPTESQLADLVPRTKTVRFSIAELNRADVKTRYEVYAIATAADIITPEEARANEGLPPSPPPIENVTAFDPTPHHETDTSLVSPAEVPVPA